MVTAVVRGLAEFHPDWLRRHFDEIPENARKDALSKMAKWGDPENPLAMLEFSMNHGLRPDPVTFKALVSKDPWTAFDWVKKNLVSSYSPFMGQLVSQMALERPDDLARLASQTPSGSAKRIMEAALFQNLLKSDPEKAIAEAEASDFPRLAADRLAAAGLSLMKTDPARAMKMAEILLQKCPDAMMRMEQLKLPGGSGDGAANIPRVRELLHTLLAEDPARMMDIIAARELGGPYGGEAFESLSDEWLTRDLMAYSDWVKQQTDPQVRSEGTGKVIESLVRFGEYRDAADWALSLPDLKRISALDNLTMNWGWKNPGKALQWLETADLPDGEKAKLRNNIPPPK